MVLSPWQRALIARRQNFQVAQRRLAQHIAQQRPPAEYLPTTPGELVVFESIDWSSNPPPAIEPSPIPLPFDPDCSFDQMQWEAEEEIEKWEDFVRELREKRSR